MSELPRRRSRRADAERSVAAILDAAVEVLGRRPRASVEEVARAAGVSRQTVYAHFATREALLYAVVRRITDEVVAALDAADLDSGPAAEALLRLVETGWRAFERYPVLLLAAADSLSGQESADLHGPVLDRLDRLVRRGQDSGEFDRELPPSWMLAVTVALGHTAGEEVAAGRMSAAEATAALRRSLLRAVGARSAPGREEPEPAAQ